MIKIERNPIPPLSLAIEAKKKDGIYNKPDVIQQLREDSNDKCYICELGGLSDPEDMLEQSYENEHVKVHNVVIEERAVMTAKLIQNCFEKRNTGIREAACQYRINRLADEMNFLYKTLEKYRKNPELQRYKRSLRATLSRTSIFAAFKRNYVRKHIEDYPDLAEYLV